MLWMGPLWWAVPGGGASVWWAGLLKHSLYGHLSSGGQCVVDGAQCVVDGASEWWAVPGEGPVSGGLCQGRGQ